jgi:predicted permease
MRDIDTPGRTERGNAAEREPLLAPRRAYRFLLLAFPRRFRAWYALDLLELYADMNRSPLRRRARHLWWDLLSNGLLARLDDLRWRWGAERGDRCQRPELRRQQRQRIPRRRGLDMSSVIHDLSFALRMIRKSPGFTLVVLLSLGLGIGANTAIFSIIDAALLRPIEAVPEPDDLVLFGWVISPGGESWPSGMSISGYLNRDDAGARTSSSFSYPSFERLRDGNDAFSHIFVFSPIRRLNVRVDGEAELTDGQYVSGGYYAGLGIRPHVGRLIVPTDEALDAEPVAVLDYGFWQRRFGADTEIVGKPIYLNGNAFSVIGVTPPGFTGTLQVGTVPKVTVPVTTRPLIRPRGRNFSDGNYWWMHMMGRLSGAVPREQALSQMKLLFERSVHEDLPEIQEDAVPQIAFRDGARGMNEERDDMVEPLMILMAIVGLVLLIACMNVANLLLARSGARRHELAVRLSLGAGRRRLLRQLLTESLVLALLAGLVGVLLASWFMGILSGMFAEISDMSIDLRIDVRLLGFVLAISALTGLVFGSIPAMRVSGFSLTPALVGAARQLGGERPKNRLSKSLLAVQVGISCVLLIVAGLFVQTLQNLEDQAVGYDPTGVLQFSIDPTLNGYEGSDLVSLYDEVLRRIRAVPGVQSATVSSLIPVGGMISIGPVWVQGYEPAEDENTTAVENMIASDYFKTLGMPVVLGRGFSALDDAASPKVAVVNEAFVEQFFAGESPIGQRFGFTEENPGEVEIVGVTSNVKYQRPNDTTYPAVHIPFSQKVDDLYSMNYLVRTDGDPLQLVGTMREIVLDVDPNLPLYSVRTQEGQLDFTLVVERQFAILSGLLGGVALVLVCIGLYGILSYTVARRTQEIGVRMALGARGEDIVRLVMRELLAVAIGIVLGIAAAFGATRFLESQLYGLTPNDPLTMGLAALIVAIVTVVAAVVPARRAARVDPVRALRFE